VCTIEAQHTSDKRPDLEEVLGGPSEALLFRRKPVDNACHRALLKGWAGEERAKFDIAPDRRTGLSIRMWALFDVIDHESFTLNLSTHHV
jgi:hypothetical protein